MTMNLKVKIFQVSSLYFYSYHNLLCIDIEVKSRLQTIYFFNYRKNNFKFFKPLHKILTFAK